MTENIGVGIGPLGAGTLAMNQATVELTSLNFGGAGGHGTLIVNNGAHLTANRLEVGRANWSVGGAGSSGFGFATLANPFSSITLRGVANPGVLHIGGATGDATAGAGTMTVSAGTLDTQFMTVTSTGLLDVRGGRVILSGVQLVSGTVRLSGTRIITSVVGGFSLGTPGRLEVSGGSFSAPRLNMGGGGGSPTIDARAVGVPHWFLALLFAMLPAWYVRAEVRSRRIERRDKRGLCLACGYDLRATPARCPECGAVPAGAVGCTGSSAPGESARAKDEFL